MVCERWYERCCSDYFQTIVLCTKERLQRLEYVFSGWGPTPLNKQAKTPGVLSWLLWGVGC